MSNSAFLEQVDVRKLAIANAQYTGKFGAEHLSRFTESLASPEYQIDYTVGFDLTKSLQLNFNVTNSYIYDTFDNSSDIQVFDDFFNTGRANHYHQKLNATYNLPIDKIPFLKFIKADYAYTADFDWQAAPQNTIDVNGVDVPSVDLIGNVIQNSNTHNLNTTINFDRFYKGLGFEKLLLTKSPHDIKTYHISTGLTELESLIKKHFPNDKQEKLQVIRDFLNLCEIPTKNGLLIKEFNVDSTIIPKAKTEVMRFNGYTKVNGKKHGVIVEFNLTKLKPLLKPNGVLTTSLNNLQDNTCTTPVNSATLAGIEQTLGYIVDTSLKADKVKFILTSQLLDLEQRDFRLGFAQFEDLVDEQDIKLKAPKSQTFRTFLSKHSGKIHGKMKSTTVEPFAYTWVPSTEPGAEPGEGKWEKQKLTFDFTYDPENPDREPETSKTFSPGEAEQDPGSSTRYHDFLVDMPDIEPGQKTYVVYKVTRRWCLPDGSEAVQIDNYYRGVVKPRS